MAWLQALTLRPRFIAAVVVGAIIALVLPSTIPVWSKILIAWCSGTVLYMALVVTKLSRATTADIREAASELDDSAVVMLVISLAAITASVGAIVALLLAPSSTDKMLDVVLAALTMVLSWAFTQTIFAVHYTHMYYGDVHGEPRGGLDFGGDDKEPDFWDFLYFTVSIGATAQTSDTVVTSKLLRRIVTAQATYSFFFNTAVLAMAVNIAAGLVGH